MLKKAIKRYQTIPAAVKASIWFTICSILQKGISFITVPIFTRLLTTEEYGLFNVFQSWSGIISILATLNLSAGVFNNGMIKYEKNRMSYTSSMQGLSTAITGILFIIYLLFHNIINEYTGLPTHLFILMFVSFLFSPALAFWSAKQRFDYKYAALVIITLIISVITPLSGIFAIKLIPYKAEARIYTSVLVSVAVSIYLYIYSFVRGKYFFIREYWIFALKFNIPLIPHYLSMTVLMQADRIMIDNLCGADKAGIYSVAYSASMVMSLITTSINSSFIPWSYKKIKEKKYNDIGKNANYILFLIFILTAMVISFAPEAVKILAPPEYYEAIWVIPLIASSVYFSFLYNLFGNIEFYFEKTKYIMTASVIGALLNIVLNYLFIPRFGYLAAGYTTMVCYIIFSVAHYFFMEKCIKEEKLNIRIYDIKIIFAISVLLVVISVAMMFLYKFVLIRYIILTALILWLAVNRKMIIAKAKELMKK